MFAEVGEDRVEHEEAIERLPANSVAPDVLETPDEYTQLVETPVRPGPVLTTAELPFRFTPQCTHRCEFGVSSLFHF